MNKPSHKVIAYNMVREESSFIIKEKKEVSYVQNNKKSDSNALGVFL